MRTISLALCVALVGASAACGSGDHVEVSQTSFGIGHGGEGGDAGSTQEKPADPVCEPGARYVCDCGSGNLGNKFCAWDGMTFGACELCGEGAQIVANTMIPCDVKAGILCPDNGDFCKPLSCWGGLCRVTTAQPGAEVPDTATNDCTAVVCDGNGNKVSVPDPDDCSGTCNAQGVCAL